MVPVDRSILLSSLSTPKLSYGFAQAGFSKEELLRLLSHSVYYRGTIEVPLGEEGFREIAITLIMNVPDTRFQV